MQKQSGRTTNWSYDALYRLTEEAVLDPASGNRTTRWTFDRVGNRLSQSDNGVVTTYVYDANGNTAAKYSAEGTTLYRYDGANRLVSVSTPTSSLAYSYAASGIRRSRTENGVTTRYLVDPNRDYAQVLAESVGGNEQVRYTYGHRLISQRRGGSAQFYHQDGLGSTRALSDAAGIVTDTYTYSAYGELEQRTGSSANVYQFTGEQYDPGLGQYYLRARYYDPRVGRLTGMDTWAGRSLEPLTLHKYLYVHADPVNRVDPSGHMALFAMPSINLGTTSIRLGSAQTGRVLLRKVGCEILAFGCDQAIDYGIYILTDGLGNWYVGQSNEIDRRLKEHARSKSKSSFEPVARFLVGGKGTGQGPDVLRMAAQYI